MSDKSYDVFISYRNNGGALHARLIYYALKSLGYEVFLDMECLEQGYDLENLMDEIEKCEDFLLILSPNALDNAGDNNDWLRFEVEKAHKLNKHIVWVLLEGFSFPNNLPDSLQFLRKQVGIRFPANMNFISASIQELVKSLKSKPRYNLIQAGMITDGWLDILAAIDDGNAQQLYKVGDWKPLNLGKFGVINMQLAGFNLDVRADGQGKASTTWIARELLTEEHVMCEYYERWTGLGWKGSELRSWLQDEVLQAFPTILRNRLVSVTKQQSVCVYNDKGGERQTQTTQDNLWIPSYPEVYGDNCLYYGLFEDKNANRVKSREGSAAWWWLRSAILNFTAVSVIMSGSYASYTVNSSGGVAIGFCL